MPADAGFWLPALSDKGLQAHFGAHVLARSQGLAVGACTADSQGAARQVMARVQGQGRLYQARLQLAPGSALRGRCDCAQGRLGRPCKHQAALALAWRHTLAGLVLPAPDGEAGVRLAVAAWFDALPAGAGPQALQGLVTSLQAWRALNPAWALAGAEQALAAVCEQLDVLQAQHATQAWVEGESAWQALAAAVAAELQAAWAALGPQPATYAERYLALRAADRHGWIDPQAALAQLGPALAARVSQLLRQSWQGGAPEQDYLQHLAACGDTAEHLHVLATLCRAPRSDAARHAAYIQALLAAGQARAALQAAEAALQRFPQDRALRALLVQRYEADGWHEEALTLRRHALLRDPTPESLQDFLRAIPPGQAAAQQDEVLATVKQAAEGALDRARTLTPACQALLQGVLAQLSPQAGRLWLAWLQVKHRGKPGFAEALRICTPQPPTIRPMNTQSTNTLLSSALHSLPLLARGKVRDNYAVGEDRILMIASDRLSAFDVVMEEPIPGKGAMLTRMALFWFERLKDIVPNHLTGQDPLAVVAPEEVPQVQDRAMLVKRLRPLPIEAVVRGYLAGSGWKEYQSTQSVCGVALPAGLRNASRLPEPIFTPATKAAVGDHDENISFEQAAALVGPALAAQVRRTAIALYERAAAYALTRGIIIADTKFEFGLDADGTLTLMDEVLTPDSSRYWPVEGYEAAFARGDNPPSYDKQFVRDWLEAQPWDKKAPAPALPAEVIERTAATYAQALQRLGVDTGTATI